MYSAHLSGDDRPDNDFTQMPSANDLKISLPFFFNANMIGIELAKHRPDSDFIGILSVFGRGQGRYRHRADLVPDASGNDSPMFQN